MSNLGSSTGDDYPEAAAKHLDDATSLYGATRYDGAGYLAGYVVECSLKTLIMVEEIARTVGLTAATLATGMKGSGTSISTGMTLAFQEARKFKHDLNRLSRRAAEFASLGSAATASYLPTGATGAAIYAGGWREIIRYRKAGYIAEPTARQWLEDARLVYRDIVAQMRRDGVVF